MLFFLALNKDSSKTKDKISRSYSKDINSAELS